MKHKELSWFLLLTAGTTKNLGSTDKQSVQEKLDI